MWRPLAIVVPILWISAYAAGGAAAETEQRVALVICNGAYLNVGDRFT